MGIVGKTVDDDLENERKRFKGEGDEAMKVRFRSKEDGKQGFEEVGRRGRWNKRKRRVEARG